MNKLIYKLARLLGIRFCNSCGKCVWWSKEALRWIESPKDKYGYLAPACANCIACAEKYRYDY